MLHSLITQVLSSPVVFNLSRKILAGNQTDIKTFISENLRKYHVKSVLDVGCGIGDFVEVVPKQVKYTGIDTNSLYIAYAKKRFLSRHSGNSERSVEDSRIGSWTSQDDVKARMTEFICQDGTDPKFYKGKKFDAIILISILHHLSDCDLAHMLPVLKKSARSVILIADIIPDPPNMFFRLLAKYDLGRFVRRKEEKIRIVSQYGKIVKQKEIVQRFAIQYTLVISPTLSSRAKPRDLPKRRLPRR